MNRSSALKPPPWRGKGEKLFRSWERKSAKVFRAGERKGGKVLRSAVHDRSGLSIEVAAWVLLAMTFASRELNAVVVALVVFALGNICGMVLGLRRVGNGGTRREVAVGAIAVVGGGIGLIVGSTLAVLFVFPFSLILFGICSADPGVWVCVQ